MFTGHVTSLRLADTGNFSTSFCRRSAKNHYLGLDWIAPTSRSCWHTGSAQMAAYASGYQRLPGGWDWTRDSAEADSQLRSEATSASQGRNHGTPDARSAGSTPKSRSRHYGPRTCRICLETVHPTFHEPLPNLPEMLQGQPTVSYDSEGGRLLRPCKCRGSSKYVHEQCLQEWRHADPAYGKRNYWNCPTCGFRYRLGRMSWANYISSTG